MWLEKIYLVKTHPALSRLGNAFTMDKSLDYYCRYFYKYERMIINKNIL